MKVGDYIRTDEGIRKIIREYDIYYELDRSLHYMYPEGHDLNKEDVDDIVLKSSPNIIDLIEVGDYVNGHYVEGVEKVPNEEVYKVIITSTCDGMDGETLNIYKEEIESIVTKEQFSSMEYKIGE